MTWDEVIAANLRQIREERKISGGALARELRVGRHVVYDYLGPRPGKTQRAFLWSEIVDLCVALDVTIFELVLPPEGARTTTEYIEPGSPNIDGALSKGSDDLREWFDPIDDRAWLMEVLFGFNSNPEEIKKLIGKKQKRVERLLKELTGLLRDGEE